LQSQRSLRQADPARQSAVVGAAVGALTASKERPIFSAARRPPRRAVAASPAEQASAPPPPKAAEDLPPLVLVGAVVGEGDAIAILMVRMRQDETRAEVTLKHGERSEVLALRQLDLPAAPPGRAAPLPFLRERAAS
jgi:general secretion pathway protein N